MASTTADTHLQVATPRNSTLILLLGGVAAFSAYFAMYAFRKPFAAATFDHVAGWDFTLDYKSALLIAQVLGYALSKFVGIRVIAEFGRRGRAWAIAGLISLAWVAMLLWAIIPAPWNVACLFLNGLPLGMIWGLVFSYVEGRRQTDLLGALMCASFVVSSGAVKSVAVAMLNAGVAVAWMPVLTGLLFVPLLAVSLWMLERLPPPDAGDIAERQERLPMDAAARRRFLRANGWPLALIVFAYIALTALRDFRDNFAPEIWTALGMGREAAVYSASELPVGMVVLVALGGMMLLRNNQRALFAILGLMLGGALLMIAATLAYAAGLIGPVPWMILVGAGIYLGYTPVNGLIFDRLVAVTGSIANAGFLIYIADASGYAGSVALLLYRSFAAPEIDWLRFFTLSIYGAAGVVALLTLLCGLHFYRRPAHG